jgi:hypothetical protein
MKCLSIECKMKDVCLNHNSNNNNHADKEYVFREGKEPCADLKTGTDIMGQLSKMMGME